MFGKLLKIAAIVVVSAIGLANSLSVPSLTTYQVDVCPEYNQLSVPVNQQLKQYVLTTCNEHKLKRIVSCDTEDNMCLLADQPIEEIMTSNLQSNHGFCIGWNVDKECQMSQPIPIVQNKFFNIDCQDCMFAFTGNVVFELDIFKREMTVGFENMLFDWSLVIDGSTAGTWGTSFTKTYNSEVHTLVNTHVGPIPIDITIELPIQVNFQISSKGQMSGEVGVQSQGMIGNLLSIYDKGRWSHQYPDPTWKITKLINGKFDESLEIDIEIIPSLILKVDSIFEGTLSFDAKAQLGETFNEKLQACINEQNTLIWQGETHLNWFHYDKTFYDILFHNTMQQCLPNIPTIHVM